MVLVKKNRRRSRRDKKNVRESALLPRTFCD